MPDLFYINILDRSSKGRDLDTAGVRRRSSQEGGAALSSERKNGRRGQQDGNRVKGAKMVVTLERLLLNFASNL